MKNLNLNNMHKINKIIWPVYFYMAILAVYWMFIEFIYVYILDKIPQLLYVFFILPIVIIIWILILLKKHNKKENLLYTFLYCMTPGIIFGLQIAYGLYAMGHGKNIIGAILPFSITAIFFGIISGLLGLLINLIINLIRKS